MTPAFRAAIVIAFTFAATAPAPAQVITRPGPRRSTFRSGIASARDRDERVRQFRVLEKHLKDLGFERTRKPDDETDIQDPTAERFEGVIASKNVFALLDDPRVKTILFKPTDYQYPADAAAPVPVRIRLAAAATCPPSSSDCTGRSSGNSPSSASAKRSPTITTALR